MLGLALPSVASTMGLGDTQRGMLFMKVAREVGVLFDYWKKGATPF